MVNMDKEDKRGFSLAELSVAMGLLVLSMGFVVGLFAQGAQVSVNQERTQAATQAGAAVLKRIANTSPGLVSVGSYSGQYSSEFSYQVDITASPLDTAYLMDVAVTVTSPQSPRVHQVLHGLKMCQVQAANGAALYLANNCNSCHAGPGLPARTSPHPPYMGSCGSCHTGGGPNGVPLNQLAPIFTKAGLETDFAAAGKANVKDYIIESVLTPSAFAVPGYTPPAHPVASAGDAGPIADYLKSITGAGP